VGSGLCSEAACREITKGLAPRSENAAGKRDSGFRPLRPVSTRAFYRDGILRGGNFHRQLPSRQALALLNKLRQCPLPVKTARLSAFRAAKRSSGFRPLVSKARVIIKIS
jgi:hypothetical protein